MISISMPKGIPNGRESIEQFTPKVCVVETPDFGSGGGSAAGFNGLSFFFYSFMNCSTTAAWISGKFCFSCRSFERASNESLGVAISCVVGEILWVEAISRTVSWNWTKDDSFDRAWRGDSWVGFWWGNTRWLLRYLRCLLWWKVGRRSGVEAEPLTLRRQNIHLRFSKSYIITSFQTLHPGSPR